MNCRKVIIRFTLLAAVMLLISSCATLSPNGVGRVKRYTFGNENVPVEFDGYKIAFISDLHYPSLFTPRRLGKLVRRLQKESPELLLLGGDYVTDNDSIDALFRSLSAVEPSLGIYAVLGNHERRNEQHIRQAMDRFGVVLLDGKVFYPHSPDAGTLVVAGVYDSFANDTLFAQYVERLDDSGFVVLLTHSPDFVERHSVTADLAFAGHTHGGQVSLLGLYTPVKNTRYGRRFLRGRNRTTNGTTIITTNGVGTSRRKVRLCVPSEIVVVTLKSKK